jgi:hypothetical protein
MTRRPESDVFPAFCFTMDHFLLLDFPDLPRVTGTGFPA